MLFYSFTTYIFPFVNIISTFTTVYKITTMRSNSAVNFWFYYPGFQKEIGV